MSKETDAGSEAEISGESIRINQYKERSVSSRPVW